MVVFKDFVFWCLQASFGLNRPILWPLWIGKGDKKKIDVCFHNRCQDFLPENWDVTWKRPLGRTKSKKKNWLPAVSFLGCAECTVYQRCFGISTFYVGLRFFSWQGFLTWPGSLFSGSISASEELHAVEGSNILNGDEEIKEEIDDAFRMVSVRMVSVELWSKLTSVFF